MVAILCQRDGQLDGLQQPLGIDTGEDETPLVQCLRALGGGADAHGRERMPNAREEGAFLRQGAGITHHTEGVQLQAVVIMEAHGLLTAHAGIQAEAALHQAVAAAGVAAVEDGHIVLLRHGVNSGEEAIEVLVIIDVLFAVGGEQDVTPFLQPQTLMDVGGFNLRHVGVEHLGHGAACHIGTLGRQAAICEVAASVLGIAEVDIADDVHDATVGFLGQALVLAAVAGFHVEDGDVQTFGTDDGETGVRVSQHQHGIGLAGHHEFVAGVDDVAAGRAEVITHGIEVHLGGGEFQVVKEDAVEVIVIVLPRVGQNHVKILTAFVDNGRETDDFRAGTDDNQQLDFAVVPEGDIRVIRFHGTGKAYTGSAKVSGFSGSKISLQ